MCGQQCSVPDFDTPEHIEFALSRIWADDGFEALDSFQAQALPGDGGHTQLAEMVPLSLWWSQR